jgi:phosphoglycolate phosphatase
VRPVGFDLDMTLMDPRPGIVATCAALTEATGRYVDGELFASRLGPPLQIELAHWFPGDEARAAADLFRSLYVEHAIPRTTLLPGAAAAVDVVRDAGVPVVVITAKLEKNAVLSLAHVGLAVDAVVGWRWGPGKTDALREHDAALYVGDHVSDVGAAHGADLPCVAVASGPCSVADLEAAGAEVVLSSLEEFPSWWASARMAP